MNDQVLETIHKRLEPTLLVALRSGVGDGQIEFPGAIASLADDGSVNLALTYDPRDILDDETVKDAEAALLDLLPEHTLLQVTKTTPVPRGRSFDSWSYYESYGQGRWIELDPSDRYDGENAVESRFIVNFVRGFGERDITRGSFAALFVPKADQL